jgi:cell division ATPase MinD
MRIIGIFSGKGGVGKSTLTVNLGAALAKRFRKRVAIVDCNITTSHLGLYLGMPFLRTTLNNVLRGETEISGALYEHNSGMMVVPASLSTRDLRGVDMSLLPVALKALLGRAEILILDAAPGLGREAMSVMRASDEVLFVTTPNVPAATDVLRCKDEMREVSNARHLGVVLNMVMGGLHEISERDVERLTELPVLASVPFDKNVLRSLAAREPVVTYRPKSPASRTFYKIAAHIAGEHYDDRSWLHKLLAMFRI